MEKEILLYFITWRNAKPKLDKTENIYVSEINQFLKEYEKAKQKKECI